MQIYFFTKIERKIYMTEEEQKEILASRIREVRMGSGMTTGNVIKRYVEEEMMKGVKRFEIK